MQGGRSSPTKMTAISGLATLIVVLLGALIGVSVRSIDVIWNWLQMSFVSGLVIPNCLRWYWWRLNGWGYSAGVITGSFCSLFWLLAPDWPNYYGFVVLLLFTTLASVLVSGFTSPTPQPVLVNFYEAVRPYGFWKLVSSLAQPKLTEQSDTEPSFMLMLFNLFVGIGGMTALYLFPMYLVGHWHGEALLCLSVLITAIVVLRFSWAPTLPADETPSQDRA
jgi:SSS family solute:Na+ symporter